MWKSENYGDGIYFYYLIIIFINLLIIAIIHLRCFDGNGTDDRC